jgi:polysaccharide biosynthesis protein PslH
MSLNENDLRHHSVADVDTSEKISPTKAMLNARHRPSLLYVSPVCPSITGAGTPMRASIVLEALSRRYRVSLLVVPAPQYPGLPRELPGALRDLCENVRMVPYDGDFRQKMHRAGRVYQSQKFDVVHVFRLASAPYAQSYLTRTKGCARHHLDLDDIESKTHRRIAELYRIAGDETSAMREEQDARRLELLETVAFRTFDRIYVCSEGDRKELIDRSTRIGGSNPNICVLRNAVRMPVRNPQRVFRFLFVGSLSYYPNHDAIRYFCAQILPLIREQANGPVAVDVVGRDGSGLKDLASPHINIIGEVPDVRIYYEACDAVIVPLRAGGGTRIKILEAFSYNRPVVTTSIGVEGINAVPDQHALIADTPKDFATACLQLMFDPDLGQSLVENAAALLEQSHTVEDLKTTMELIGEPKCSSPTTRRPKDSHPRRISRIYVLGNVKDLHLTRCCVASIRHWYPDIPISLVKDGEYDTSELERCWDIEIFNAPKKHFGFGMSKFQVLFQPTQERCLILDSDIVLAGPILGALEEHQEDFVVEGSNYPTHDIRSHYYDPDVVSVMYPSFRFPGYVFNTGQIVATTGVLEQNDFAAFIDFNREPPTVLRSDVFKAGDQGIVNFVMHKKEQEGAFSIARHVFLRWPPAMQSLDVEIERFQAGLGYDFLMHWAGSKSSVLEDNAMSHVLRYFERFYLQKTIPPKPPSGDMVRQCLTQPTAEGLLKPRRSAKPFRKVLPVILTCDRVHSLTSQFVDSFRTVQSGLERPVVVVDISASTKLSLEFIKMLEALEPKVIAIHAPPDERFYESVNDAANFALRTALKEIDDDSHILFLEDDIIFSSHFLDRLAPVRSESGFGLLTFYLPGHGFGSGRIAPNDFYGTQCVLFTRNAVEVVVQGREEMDAQFPPAWDLRWARYLGSKGFSLHATEKSYVQHLGTLSRLSGGSQHYSHVFVP